MRPESPIRSAPLGHGGVEDLVCGHHDPEVDHLETVAGQHHPHDVLTDVVDVPLDGGQQYRTCAARSARIGLEIGLQVGDGPLHHPGTLDHLREEHLASAEEIADHVHARHQRPLDDLERLWVVVARLFGVGHDVFADAVDQGVFEPFLDGCVAPAFVPDPGPATAADRFREGDQPLGSVGAAVQDHILDVLEQVGGDLLVDPEHGWIDDAHIHPRLPGVVEEGGVHGFAHGVVAAKAEAQVGDAARHHRSRQVLFDPGHGADEVEGEAVVRADAGGDGQHVGIEDDVVGRERQLLGQDVKGAFTDGDTPLEGICLTHLIEGHDDHCGAVAPRQTRLLFERLGALLEADGVHHALALDPLQARFDHRPLGGVDDDRQPRDVGLGRHHVQERRHRLLAVEEALVHVHVDHLGAALDLAAGDLECGFIVAHADEPGEAARTGHVGAFADVHEVGFGPDHERLEAAEAGVGWRFGRDPRGQPGDRLGEDADVAGGGPAAAAYDIAPACLQEVAEHGHHALRRFVVAAEGVGQTRVGVRRGEVGAQLRQLFDVGPQLLGT